MKSTKRKAWLLPLLAGAVTFQAFADPTCRDDIREAILGRGVDKIVIGEGFLENPVSANLFCFDGMLFSFHPESALASALKVYPILYNRFVQVVEDEILEYQGLLKEVKDAGEGQRIRETYKNISENLARMNKIALEGCLEPRIAFGSLAGWNKYDDQPDPIFSYCAVYFAEDVLWRGVYLSPTDSEKAETLYQKVDADLRKALKAPPPFLRHPSPPRTSGH